jgi:hypothetical protein
MLVLRSPCRQLYYWCGLLKDFAATIENEAIMCRYFREGYRQRTPHFGSVAFQMIVPRPSAFGQGLPEDDAMGQ